MSTTEGNEWRKFLQPLVTALVTALSAYAVVSQHGSEEKTESRFVAIELRQDIVEKRSDKYGADIDNFKALLSDIRSDVSFIRGKMEKR